MSCMCPQCRSKAYKRNGFTRHGKQNHRCLDCGRQFSMEPYPPLGSQENVENHENLIGENLLDKNSPEENWPTLEKKN